MMYTNYECDGYKFTLAEENKEDKEIGCRTYILFKDGNYLKNIHISKGNLEDNFVLRYKFINIIEDCKKNQQFPCDSYACGAELNEYRMPKYKSENKQMTRQEALHKMAINGFDDSQFIWKLEALGLIKFEEEKKDIINSTKEWLKDKHFSNNTLEVIEGLLKELEKCPKIGESVIVVTPNTYREVIGYFKGKHAP